jgi:PAS domain-containing protein
MIDPTVVSSGWARRLAALRREAGKRSRGAAASDVTEEALSMCEALVRELAGAQLAHDRLRADLRVAEAAWDHLFDVMPTGCLLTDESGSILKANRAAGALLNVSATHLRGRALLVFSEDREAFRALLTELRPNCSTELRARMLLRPRERKPALMQLQVIPSPRRDQEWFWIVAPATGAEATPFLEIPLLPHGDLARPPDTRAAAGAPAEASLPPGVPGQLLKARRPPGQDAERDEGVDHR